jgi:hypothetical protein
MNDSRTLERTQYPPTFADLEATPVAKASKESSAFQTNGRSCDSGRPVILHLQRRARAPVQTEDQYLLHMTDWSSSDRVAAMQIESSTSLKAGVDVVESGG